MAKLPKKKQIKLIPRLRKALIAELGISEPTLYNAFSYKIDSELSTKIRQIAFARYNAKVQITSLRPMTEEDI